VYDLHLALPSVYSSFGLVATMFHRYLFTLVARESIAFSVTGVECENFASAVLLSRLAIQRIVDEQPNQFRLIPDLQFVENPRAMLGDCLDADLKLARDGLHVLSR